MCERNRLITALLSGFSTSLLALGLFALGSFGLGPAQVQAAEEGDEQESITPSARKASGLLDGQEAVQNRFFYKAHRFELFPHVFGMVLSNSFAYRFVPFTGLMGSYHFSEQLSGEVIVDYFTSLPGYDLKSLTIGLSQYIHTGELLPEIPEEKFYVGAGLSFSPIYGKLNLVSSHVQNFDLSFVAGAGLLGVQMSRYQYDIDDNGNILLELSPEASRQFAAGSLNLGIGLRLFMTDWLTLRADLRGHGYLDTVAVYENDVQTGYRKVFRPAVVLNTGVSGFFPFKPE